jgi:hypothetical protein
VPASFCNRTVFCCDTFASCDTCNANSGCGWCGTSSSCVTTEQLQTCPVPAGIFIDLLLFFLFFCFSFPPSFLQISSAAISKELATRARRKLNATGAMAKRPPVLPQTPVRPDRFRIPSVVWTMLTVPRVTRLGAPDVGGAVSEISVRTEIIPVRMLDHRVAKPRMVVRHATTTTMEFANFAPTMESVWTRRRVCVPIRPIVRAAM